MKKWKQVMFWTWGIFWIFILTTFTAIFFLLLQIPGPLISPKKNSSNYRVHGTQNDRLESRVSIQKLVWSPEILAKRSQNMQVWFGNPDFGTFWLISQDPLHIFQNRFLHWNRELKPVVLSTMKPINETKIVCLIWGSRQICRPKLSR